MFGSWTEPDRLASLAGEFQTARPFDHVVIPDFFVPEVAKALLEEFPDPGSPAANGLSWHHYDNPIENKWALNDFDSRRLPIASHVFDHLQSSDFVEKIRTITGITNLEADPHLHGAGLHAYPSGGKLDSHLDYSIHPVSGKERRVNLLVYLNPDWHAGYGGSLELWDADRTQRTAVIPPGWNCAVLFRTSDISWHGLPRPLRCPPGDFRRSLAIYYVSDARPDATPRPKAEFVPDAAQEPIDPRLARLYEIRKQRLITPEDLADWPSWRQDGAGWW